jgi:hypothetical protein
MKQSGLGSFGCPKGPDRGEAQRRADMLETELAIHLNEGEALVERVVSHEVEHESLFFVVRWVGTEEETEEDLESLVDADGTVNEKLVEYAQSVKLDLEPYIKALLAYLTMPVGSGHGARQK